MPILELDNVSLSFGSVIGVRDVSLTIEKGEFLSLLGPSGSGKTSTLRLIGGFQAPDKGTIRLNGQRIDHLPPYRRDTATIFQSGALFPHKTVYQNIAFGLRMRNVDSVEIRKRVGEALEIVGLAGLGDRLPGQLSGGQRQRVALARSLAVRPAVLLFDEPLSALDLSLRVRLRAEIRRLHQAFGFTAIYVTHDQGEAMALSDRVAVMNEGRIEQIATPEVIFHASETEFVHTFVGESCAFILRIEQGRVKSDEGENLPVVLSKPAADGPIRLYLRPARHVLGEAAALLPNRAKGRFDFAEFLGETWRHHIVIGHKEVIVDRPERYAVEKGAEVEIGWVDDDMRVFR